MKKFSFALLLCLFLLPVLLRAAEETKPEKNRVEFLNMPYVKNGGERQQLDLYLPKDYKEKTRKLPLIVWIHGGGWLGGNKENPPAVNELLALDYACASLNYRFSNTAVFPAQIEDCKAAIRWLRAHAKDYNLDAEHIGVWGASAGGHLVALLGTTGKIKLFDVGEHLDQPSDVQAVIDIFGPTDFLIMAEEPEKFAVVIEPVVSLFGGHPKDKRELAKQASPMTYVAKDNAPFLILHGDADKLVNVDQSNRFHEALRKAGIESELVVLKGAGHGGDAFTEPRLLIKIALFFEKNLKQTK